MQEMSAWETFSSGVVKKLTFIVMSISQVPCKLNLVKQVLVFSSCISFASLQGTWDWAWYQLDSGQLGNLISN